MAVTMCLLVSGPLALPGDSSFVRDASPRDPAPLFRQQRSLVRSEADVAAILQQQRPGFGADVARVRVDVIVTDGDEFVADLEPEDFRLFEDGVEQPILGVQLVDLAADASAPPVDAREGVAAPRPPPSGLQRFVFSGRGGATDQDGLASREPTDLAAVVYVVNGLGAGCRGLSRFARQWGRMYGDADRVDVPHSVLLIDFLGYVHELVSYTRDVDELRAAAQRVRGKPFLDGSVEEVYEQNFVNTCTGSPISHPEVRTFELLTAITEVLGARPGRKALVWVSRNMSMEAASVRRGLTFDPFDMQRADRVQEEFERAANTAGVSVYGVDPGLVTWFSLSSASSSVGPVDRILRDPFVGSFSDRRNYLNEVSRNTGGRAFIRWSDIPKALRRVERETARFYLITYAPPDPPDDGEYHEIRVEVNRRSVEVRARDGYHDISDAERLRRAEAARRLLAEPSPLLREPSR